VHIAGRLNGVPANEIRAIVDQVGRLRAEGRSVVSFLAGEPDFDSPPHIKEAAKEALDAGFVHYVPSRGIPQLCVAVSDNIRRLHGLEYDPMTEVIVTSGAAGGLGAAFYALVESGDEVLIPDPGWNNYRWGVQLAGGVAVPIPLSATSGFQIDPVELASLITPRTKVLVLNNPHNPTGSQFSKETLLAIAELAAERNLVVISDEIYEHLVHGDQPHVNFASLPGMRERTIVVNGVSKAYAMTGWRVGYAVGPATAIDAMLKVHQYFVSSATSFAQYGALEALTGPQACVVEMAGAFRERAALMSRRLREIPGIDLVEPTATLYAFPNVAALGGTSVEIAERLLVEAGVAMVPGTVFGRAGEGHLRLSYSYAPADIEEGMDRLEHVFRSLTV